MNTLNYIKSTNKVIYFITIGLYLTLYFGMLFQIVLGICQIATAIYITCKHYKSLGTKNKKRVKTYWAVSLLILTAAAFSTHYSDLIAGTILFVIPMGIATYFLILLSSIVTEINEL